ncbi:MAG: leucine-rich repeat protein [Candidatus Azobacteroides sp.]|nr:leucine-rich repeat protein [Candidatus Azobacteroides sp.]
MRLKQVLFSVVCLFSVSQLWAYDFEVGGIYYNKEGKNVLVTYSSLSYGSYRGDVIIPETVSYQGVTYQVTGIDHESFKNCPELTSVIIPDNVVNIGYSAFEDCTGLTAISLPKHLTRIEHSAFSGCINLASVSFAENISYIGRETFEDTEWYKKLPDGIIYIGNVLYKYKGDMPLNTSIKVKEGIKSIGWLAFGFCENLTSVVLPASLVEIGDYAFSNCKGLTSVDIPENVTTIGNGAFAVCTGLTVVEIPKNVTKLGVTAFLACTELTTINIPGGVENIESECFSECTKLTSVYIEKGVKYVGSYAFYGCTSLKFITLPETVTGIGGLSFAYCPSLFAVILSENMTFIGGGAFFESRNIKEIYAPWEDPSLVSLEDYHFNNVFSHLDKALFKFTVPKGTLSVYQNTEVWKDFKFEETLFDFKVNGIYYYLKDNEAVVSCRSKLGQDYQGKIEIPAAVIYQGKTYPVTTIGAFSFCWCEDITEIILPKGLKSIEHDAFVKCQGLSSTLVLPEGLTDIGENAFSHCAFEEINIPESVVKIGTHAFEGCKNLISVRIPSKIEEVPSSCFVNCSALSSISMPGVKKIALGAFGYCSSLTSLVFHEGLEYISAKAFMECLSLEKIAFSETINYIEEGAFLYSVNIKEMIAPWNDPSSVTLRYSQMTGWDPFYSINREECKIIIPSGSLAAYQSAKYWQDFRLEETSLSFEVDGVWYYPEGNKAIVIRHNKEEKGYKGELIIPATVIYQGNLYTVTGIGRDAFSGCTELQSVTLPSSITQIAEAAFSGCENLKSLTLPFIGLTANSTGREAILGSLFGTTSDSRMRSVVQYHQEGQWNTYYFPQKLETLTVASPCTTIGYGALYNCSSLKEVTLASTVNGIGENAFYFCSGLENIYSQNALPPGCMVNTFNGVNTFTCILHVPSESKAFYEKATGWKEFQFIQGEAPVLIKTASVPLNGGVIIGGGEYLTDVTATLSALPHAGYEFKGWMEEKEIISTDREYTFTTVSSRMLYAVFAPRENADPNVTINAQPTVVEITWSEVEGATGYVLIIYSNEARTQEYARFRLDENGNILKTATAEGEILICIIEDLNPEASYYYTLTSYNEENEEVSISAGNFVTQPLSIGDVSDSRPLVHFYPNPVTDVLTVEGAQGSELTMTNLQGKVIFKQKINNPVETFLVKDYEAGIYLMKVEGEKTNTVVYKIIKQ